MHQPCVNRKCSGIMYYGERLVGLDPEAQVSTPHWRCNTCDEWLMPTSGVDLVMKAYFDLEDERAKNEEADLNSSNPLGS